MQANRGYHLPMNVESPGLHQRFLLEAADIRGEAVHLGPLWRQIASRRPYPKPLLALLGEFASLAVIIAAGLKAPGRAVLQVMGQGPVSLAVADCTQDLQLRAMIKTAPESAFANTATVQDLLANGRLALTLENHATGRHFQSIVPLEGTTLAECFERYFDLSEQVPTHVWVQSSGEAVTALVLQKLPGADRKDPNAWARVQQEAACRAPQALAAATPGEAGLAGLVATLFTDDDIRVYPAREVADGCSRSEEKVIALLRGLGRAEVDATLDAEGVIAVHDELCNQEYRFTREDVARIFPD